MDKKKKALGLLVSGAAVLSINTTNVFAEENQNVTNENTQNENVVTDSKTLSTEENKKNLPIEVENKTDSDVTFDGKYDIKEEAELRKTEKETEYKNDGYEDIKSEITVIKDTKGTEVFDHFELEVVKDAYTDKTLEEAEEIKDELEQDPNITASIRETGEVFDHNETTDFSEKFENQDEADKIISDLEDEGYTVSDVTYTYDTGTETVTLSKEFEELEDAEAALDEFKQNNTVTSESINKIPDSTEDVTETYSEDFDNENDAKSYKETEEGKTSEDVTYTAETAENATETEELYGVYETQEEAEAAIAEFEASHAVLDSESNIEVAEAGTIYNATVITKDMKTYEVGSTTYVIIKKGNDHVIWTEKELTSEEQDAFIESYKEHEDNVVTYRKLKQRHTFISGYGENNYSGNGKLFVFYEEDGKTYIQMASAAESRVIAGEFQPINEYVATASGHNITYTVNVTKVTKGYDYQVEAEGTREITLESGKLNGKKTKAVNRKVYSIDLSIQKEVYKTVFDDDYELKITGVKKEKAASVSANPQTSDNVSNSFIMAFISFISLILATLGLKSTKEEK